MRTIRSATLVTVAAALAVTLSSCSIWSGNDEASSGAGGRKIGAVAVQTPKRATTYAFSSRQPVKVIQVDSISEAPAEPAQFKRTAFLGNAPYICSPSGFGRKSACFLR